MAGKTEVPRWEAPCPRSQGPHTEAKTGTLACALQSLPRHQQAGEGWESLPALSCTQPQPALLHVVRTGIY